MKSFLLLVLLFLNSIFGAHAQQIPVPADTSYNYLLKEVSVKAKWLNDTDRYHYNQMKHYVKIILPYLNAATTLFNEVNTKLAEPDLSRKERKQFISAKEEEMRAKFEDKVKGLNTTQGILLVKLIARQTNLNVYKMMQDFKGPLPALKWQTWGRFNGLNLDRKYHPEEEMQLENIMEELGYPLPVSYATNNN